MTLETPAVIESGDGLAVLHGSWADGSGRGRIGVPRSRTEVVRAQPDGTWLFVIENPHTPL
jgi:hypothetical protein